MRARLIALLVLLMGSLLAALTVPFAQDLAARRQQIMFVDRLQDTIGIASAAQQDIDDVDRQELNEDLARYADLYGIKAAVVYRSSVEPRAAGGPPIDLNRADVKEAIGSGLAGHQSADPPVIWPWSNRPMIVVVPIIRTNDVIGVALTESSTDQLRSAVALRLVVIAIGEVISLILLVGLALRLSSWVLRPVYLLDGAAHQIS